jgi:hypothetical protein
MEDQRTRAVVALAQGMSTEAAGEVVGVAGRTIRNWRREPDFAAALEAARREILTETVIALGHTARRAVDALDGTLEDENPNVRINAARAALSTFPSISNHVSVLLEQDRMTNQMRGERVLAVLRGVLAALGHDPDAPDVRAIIVDQIRQVTAEPQAIMNE